jgi:hypothetical protein
MKVHRHSSATRIVQVSKLEWRKHIGVFLVDFHEKLKDRQLSCSLVMRVREGNPTPKNRSPQDREFHAHHFRDRLM